MVNSTLVASNREIGVVLDGEKPTTNIKIRFKKGAVFLVAGGDSPGLGDQAAKIPIRLSPDGVFKRKVDAEVDLEDDEHATKRIRTGEVDKDITANPSDSKAQNTNKRAASPAGSTTTNTTDTVQAADPPKKTPVQAASIFRKLSRKLANHPTLLDDFKAYRTMFTAQRREDTKTIASLRTALGAATDATATKDERTAEDQRAMQDMIEFWTDACNKEFERAELVKKRMRGFADDIEALLMAEVVNNASISLSKDRHIGLELQKVVVEMDNVAAGGGYADRNQRMEDSGGAREI